MRDHITRDVSICGVCQKQKKQHKKYGLLPEKKAEFNHGIDCVLICKNNRIENSKRIPYQYRVGDQVMLENHHANKYEQPAYKGPYLVMQVNDNGTVCLKMGAVTDTVNIR
jgi:co-chaperonin GroES (HSP10)